jgi:hypothetical protein
MPWRARVKTPSRVQEADISGFDRELDIRPRFWEELRDKYVPLFDDMNDDEDAAAILSGFEATARHIEEPIEKVEFDGGVVKIIGVCHSSKRSIERVKECAAGHDAVVLEICEERAASVLACPWSLRRRWFKSMIWDAAADPGLWHDFSWDQLHVAASEGSDMATAIAHGPRLAVLADAPESCSDPDISAREKLIAVACSATVRMGCPNVLCVVGADHVAGVKEQLRAASCSRTENLQVECEEFIAQAWFLGPRALGKIRNVYSCLERTFDPEVIAMQRHEKTFKKKQNGQELRVFEDLTELSDSVSKRTPPGTLIRSLHAEGLACWPSTLNELQHWSSKEMGKQHSFTSSVLAAPRAFKGLDCPAIS